MCGDPGDRLLYVPSLVRAVRRVGLLQRSRGWRSGRRRDRTLPAVQQSIEPTGRWAGHRMSVFGPRPPRPAKPPSRTDADSSRKVRNQQTRAAAFPWLSSYTTTNRFESMPRWRGKSEPSALMALRHHRPSEPSRTRTHSTPSCPATTRGVPGNMARSIIGQI